MTIEQKAREIALIVAEDGGVSWSQEPYAAARLGIIEGLEMAAKVAEQWNENSPYSSRATAIRALIEEQKV